MRRTYATFWGASGSQSLGENAKAIESFEQALEIARRLEDPRAEATILGNLGPADASMGKGEKSHRRPRSEQGHLQQPWTDAAGEPHRGTKEGRRRVIGSWGNDGFHDKPEGGFRETANYMYAKESSDRDLDRRTDRGRRQSFELSADGSAYARHAWICGDTGAHRGRDHQVLGDRWGSRSVGFMDNPSADLRRRILLHMNAWGTSANVEFLETKSDAHVRIAREGGADGGYWSYVGTDNLHISNDRQTMNLEGFSMNTSESEYRRGVRHETGHTLGFPHEHMRKALVDKIDTAKAIEYFIRTRGWSEQEVRAQSAHAY